jgi:hypothetical protein
LGHHAPRDPDTTTAREVVGFPTCLFNNEAEAVPVPFAVLANGAFFDPNVFQDPIVLSRPKEEVINK